MNKNLLLEKITKADFNFYPFKFLYIENFIPEEDFQEIIDYPQITLKEAKSDSELIDLLHSKGWEAINFPGSTWDKKMQSDPDRIKSLIENTVPMNRFGTPEEIASAAAFLCSARANFITGSVLVIDGGQTIGIF